MRKRLLSFVLAVLMIATLLPVTALAYTTYYINGVAVRCDDFDSSPNECWTYANNIYNKIWGQQFNSLFDDSANSLRNLSDSELTLTAEHLRNYVSNAALGSALRICNSEYLHGGDGWGHSQIIVQKDSNGFTVLQGGLSASPYRNERYYTWSEYLNSWNYAYIKYIKWPGAPAYGGGTVTPDPGLSVKETITCKRTIKLPERVVNLYSNPTDTTRLTYFDYGPTVYSSRYAVMSDGSIMYEVGATNHQGQDIKVWLKYESDMTVTKQHTYGSTQYESAHPHRGYKTCQCGDKFYTGETTSRSDCSECNGNVKYAVDGGYITFDKKTGTITACDSTVTKANIPQKIEGVAVKSIGESAFRGCEALTSVTIPNSVTNIGQRAFSGCKALTSITIPNSVTNIGKSAFSECKALTSVTIPDSVTSIREYTFFMCESLVNVTIPNGVTSIGEEAFSGCKSLTSVTIPDSVMNIDKYAFYDCESLTGIWVGKGNRYYSSDASGVLFSKDQTTLIQCPNTFKAYAIPNSVINIGRDAFAHCKSLTSVTIPDSVTSIGVGGFSYCDKLTDVYYTGAETAWNKIEISDYNEALKNATIHYNSASHEHSYTAVVTAPTCTSKGYTTHTCACGDSYVDTYVDALGHAWDSGKVTKQPTATETGIRTFTCTRCSETKTETIPKLTHEHSYTAVVTPPTCTEKGYTTHTCSCGDSYVDTYVDALGHAWDSGTVTKQPTATETGVRTYTCTRCSATKTETIPATGSVDVTQMFTDVTKNWAYPGIQYCVTHGIMGGMGDGTFAPTGTTTRAQIVQILYNLEGTPAVSGMTPFTDLTANWYKPAILWAYQNNVVAGTSPTTFDPDQPVTREQIAVILTQYMFNVLKMERTWTPADLSTFPDGAQVSGWAKEAMQDAVALGLINGTKMPDGAVYLDPQGSAARQQVATILMNFCQNVKK